MAGDKERESGNLPRQVGKWDPCWQSWEHLRCSICLTEGHGVGGVPVILQRPRLWSVGGRPDVMVLRLPYTNPTLPRPPTLVLGLSPEKMAV